MTNFQRKRFLVAATALSGALALGACDRGPAKSEETPESGRPVLVAPVKYAPQSMSRDFVATIRPRVESDQGFRVSGKVVKRHVEMGKRVKAGEPLALLDENDLRLQKEQAEAEFAAAKMALAQAEGDEKRALTLRKSGWVAQAAVDRARAGAEEARGRFRRAERGVELSRNALDYATLRADGDGVVTQTLIEPGQVVAAGQTAVRVARAGELEAAVSLPEDFAAIAGKGDATLTLWSNKAKTYRAKLRELSPSADPMTRTFSARYTILDPDPSMSLGMSATLSIAAPDAQPMAVVPLSALFNQGAGSALWRVGADGRLQLVPVKLVRYEANSAVVTGGVSEGDDIVVIGVHKLDAGQKVRAISQGSH